MSKEERKAIEVTPDPLLEGLTRVADSLQKAAEREDQPGTTT